MSQLNNNNQEVRGTGNEVAEELRKIKIEQQHLKREDKRIRFRCDHKDSHGRPALQHTGEDGVMMCRICGTRIQMKVLNLVEVNRKVDEVLNLLEQIKLASPSDISGTIAKVEEGLDSMVGLYERVILKPGNNNKNKNNNNNNGNQRKASYSSSKL